MRETSRPLQDVTVMVTRPADDAVEFIHVLQVAGASTIVAPLLKISWLLEECLLDVIRHFSDFDAVVVSSGNALRALMKARERLLEPLKTDPPRLFVVGKQTQKVATLFGLAAQSPPSGVTGNDLATYVLQQLSPGARVVLPQGQLVASDMADLFIAGGLNVTTCTCYQTDFAEVDAVVWRTAGEMGRVVIPFFSPSAVASYMAQCLPMVSQYTVPPIYVSIGPTTSAAMAEAGLPVHGQAHIPSVSAIVQAIEATLDVNPYTQNEWGGN